MGQFIYDPIAVLLTSGLWYSILGNLCGNYIHFYMQKTFVCPKLDFVVCALFAFVCCACFVYPVLDLCWTVASNLVLEIFCHPAMAHT